MPKGGGFTPPLATDLMRTMLSITLLSAIVSMVVGCETSNQNYDSAGRVIDATASKAVVRDTGLAGSGMVIDSPSTLGGTSSVGTGGTTGGTLSSPVNSPITDSVISEVPLGSNSSSGNAMAPDGFLDVGVMSGASSEPDPTINIGEISSSGGTLLGGVPDEPWMSGTQPAAQGAINASVGGDLLAQNNATPKSTTASSTTNVARSVPDSSAATMYQNKITATDGADSYKVVQGDTLYSIAFRYGLDYHTLAKINDIEPPYKLSVGQVLRLNLKEAQEVPSYVVQQGDTLYSIARKNGQSVDFLAGVNDLQPPYTLKLGQKLLLARADNAGSSAAKDNTSAEIPVAGNKNTDSNTTASTGKANASSSSSTSSSSSSSTTASTSTPKPSTPATAQTPIIKTKTRTVSGVVWSWPTTSGRVIEGFSTTEQGNKGVDISGQRGQAVLAAADGQVVYSGNALRGFGNLVIINHSNEYLSAYAHNESLLVKEGQKIKRGQQIANMGNTDASSVRLHFEIRYRGQSVNPLSYLPK